MGQPLLVSVVPVDSAVNVQYPASGGSVEDPNQRHTAVSSTDTQARPSSALVASYRLEPVVYLLGFNAAMRPHPEIAISHRTLCLQKRFAADAAYPFLKEFRGQVKPTRSVLFLNLASPEQA